MYQDSTIEKMQYIREMLAKDKMLKQDVIWQSVKDKFGSGVGFAIIKKLILEVRPDYNPNHWGNRATVATVEKPAISSEDKVKVANLFQEFAKLGVHHNVVRKAIDEALRKKKPVEFSKENAEQAVKSLMKTKIACFKLACSGKIYLVNSDKVEINDNRGGSVAREA